MAEELINFDLPTDRSSIIKVVGVGGGGNNAVNYMFRQGIKDVNFVICNTDAQALENSPVGVKIQLGASLTEGRGAGNKPEIGRKAAIESIDEIMEILAPNTKMVFITAGMGGGTGTGAAPVIAKAAKEAGILTVAIVTLPFRFEGQQRLNQAILGINELKENVDSLLIINNEKLREIFGNLKLSEAFGRADNILATAAKGIAEIITVHGYINVDFADVQTIMTNSGVSILGSGVAEGEDRAIKAIQQALVSPLLNNNDITGARNILLNIASGEEEISMDEVGIITDYVTQSISKDALIIWGTGIDSRLENKISVTIIATGFDSNSIPELQTVRRPEVKPERIPLNDTPIHNFNDSVLKVKDKSVVNSEGTVQRTIEFSEEDMLFNEPKQADFEVKVNPQKAAERVNTIKKTHTRVKESGYTTIDEKSNIEELENIPAYIRKNIKIDQKPKADNAVSRYSLSTDDDNNIRLKENNSYLYDNVD
ncbi:MAG TPA: cell division protein FtsZ [Bacteroidales bacterium]|nr:cell division protein FtsZ [Bacteroidales bacterium]